MRVLLSMQVSHTVIKNCGRREGLEPSELDLHNLVVIQFWFAVCPQERERWTAESNGLNPLIAVSPPEKDRADFFILVRPRSSRRQTPWQTPSGRGGVNAIRNLLSALAPPVGGIHVHPCSRRNGGDLLLSKRPRFAAP